ncbi:MAG: neutral zinc metallopeptidase [Verrucomicrobiota bacterium]
MEWKGRRESDNVEDTRGRGPTGGGGGGGGLGLLMTIGRIFGFKGVLVAMVVGALLWMTGLIDPGMLLGGGPSSGSAQQGQVEAGPEEQERYQFVKVVLGETEDVWTKEFARVGRRYELPKLEVYRGRTVTGCGGGSAEMGPFYCPEDRKVYIDLSFYDELARTFNSPGDFAQAYVLAHEVGHHVQKLLGTSDKVAAMRGRPDYNEYSVRLELQADYYAGVWANHSQQNLKLDKSDIEEAMRAANAIGDDAIQKKTQGRVVPHSFTHGTSAQRMRWFNKGLASGKIEGGDTFSMAYQNL